MVSQYSKNFLFAKGCRQNLGTVFISDLKENVKEE